MDILSKKRSRLILLLAPALLIYLMFAIIPIFQSFWYSFFNWDGINQKIFIGVQNYLELFSDSDFYVALKNVFIILIGGLFVQIPVAYFFASILSKKLKGTGFFKSVYFIPVIISTMIVALMWSFILSPDYGLLNTFLKSAGLGKLALSWIGDKNLAIFSIAFVNVWQFVGMTMLLTLAGLQTIPEEINESCELDGAHGFIKTFKIDVPLIAEQLKTCIILNTVGSLKTFDLVYALTNGGPGHSSDVLATYMYRQSITGMRYGYGMAVSVVIFLLALIISATFLKITQRDESK